MKEYGEELLKKPLVIFDGDCSFCRLQIEKIKRRDRLDQFEFSPRQESGLLKDHPELLPYENQDGLRFISIQRNVFVGADSVYQIYKRIFPFNLVTWVYKLPLFHAFFQIIYQWISKNRLKLSGKCENDVCEVPYEDR